MEKWTEEVLQGAIDLGDGVPIPLAQGALFYAKEDRNELYLYLNGTPGTFYAVEAETGQRLFSEKVLGVDCVTSMIAASDNNVYFSGPQTLYRYLPDQRRIESLGTNPCGSLVVWSLDESGDGIIYGACYPKSKAFSYRIATGEFEDLGEMQEGEQYARGVTAFSDRLLFGIGTTAGVVEYDRATGERRELPVPDAGEKLTINKVFAAGNRYFISTGVNMLVCDRDTLALIRRIEADYIISAPAPRRPDTVYYKSGTKLYVYNLTTDEQQEVEGVPSLPNTGFKAFQWIRLQEGEKAGKTVLAAMAAFTETIFIDPEDGWCRFVYPDVDAEGVEIQSLECSPEGLLFIGGYQRGMGVFDSQEDRHRRVFPSYHQPEGIAFWQGEPVLGTYTHAHIYAGEWDRPEGPGFVLEIGERQDRPFALHPHGDKLYIGTIPTYGERGGAVTVCSKNEANEWHASVYRGVVEDQSIVGLAVRGNILFGSTSIWGGLGLPPVAEHAVMFQWDVERRVKVKEWLPELPGLSCVPQYIGSLSLGPDGLIWGVTDADAAVFAIEPDTLEVVKLKRLYPECNVGSRWRPYYLRWGADGLLYTSAGRRISVLNPETMEHKLLVERSDLFCLSPQGSLYFSRKSRLMKLVPALS